MKGAVWRRVRLGGVFPFSSKLGGLLPNWKKIMIIGGEGSVAAPRGQRAAGIWPEFLHVGVKIQRAPPASRGTYTTLEPNLLGMHPEDEERESRCLLGHGAQQSLHLHQAAGSWSRERLWLCIADERPHPKNFHPRQDPRHRSDTLPGWQQMETLAASPHADYAKQSCGLHTFRLLKISPHLHCSLHPHLPSVFLLFFYFPDPGLDVGFPLSCDEPARVRGWSLK